MNQPSNRGESARLATVVPVSVPSLDKKWITGGITTEAIRFAEDFGKYLAGDKKEARGPKLTTSQIRNFFGEVRRIQMQPLAQDRSRTDFLLLQPKLAYAAARANNEAAKSFQREMQKALEAVDVNRAGDSEQAIEKRFRNFCDLLEAILAYHKANGGE
jgi:CRISPR-associated protein Csm2